MLKLFQLEKVARIILLILFLIFLSRTVSSFTESFTSTCHTPGRKGCWECNKKTGTCLRAEKGHPNSTSCMRECVKYPKTLPGKSDRGKRAANRFKRLF